MRKRYSESHTPPSSKGMGDFYGTGIRQKVGRMREDQLGFSPVTPQNLKKPPKSLA